LLEEKEETRKKFFFEKKNQKTFVCALSLAIRRAANHTPLNTQKFFASFFQKRPPFFLYPGQLTANALGCAPSPSSPDSMLSHGKRCAACRRATGKELSD